MVNSLINPQRRSWYKINLITKTIRISWEKLHSVFAVVFFTRDWGKNFDNWSFPLRNSWLDQYQDQPAKMSIISLSPLFLLLCSLPRHIWSSCSLWNYWSPVCKTYNGYYQWKWQALCSEHVFIFVLLGPAVLNQEWDRRGSASNLINCFLWELIQPKFRSGAAGVLLQQQFGSWNYQGGTAAAMGSCRGTFDGIRVWLENH